MSKSGAVALVTGASRGIGAAAARVLAEQGYRVAVNYRQQAEAAGAVVRSIRSAGGEAMAVQADVGDWAAVQAMVRTINGELGPIAVLVNNAGIVLDRPFLQMDPNTWAEVLRVNLDGVYHCSRAAAYVMAKSRGGRIINLSSISGLVGRRGQANYAAAKAAILGLTRTLAIELGPHAVTVNTVVPGLIPTDMTEGFSETEREQIAARLPLRRLGTPDDVAGAIAFLASDAARYITGQTLVVDGGLTCVGL